MIFSQLNYWAIIAATAVSMVLGFLWYGPVFGKLWLKESKIDPESIDKKGAMFGYFVSLITSFIQSMSMALLIYMLKIDSLLNGLYIGAGISFLFIITTYISNEAYEKRSIKLLFINSGYRFVYFIIIGIILAVWK